MSNRPLLLPLFFQFSSISSIVGILLSPLDLCDTFKIKLSVLALKKELNQVLQFQGVENGAC